MQAQLAQLDEDADAHTLVQCTLNRMPRRLKQTADLFFEDAGTSSTGGISAVSLCLCYCHKNILDIPELCQCL